MAVTPSSILALGTPAPQFRLRDFDGRLVGSDQFTGLGLLVAFICPHCPFVKHVASGFAAFAREYLNNGLAIVGINSNDASIEPADSPAGMKMEAEEAGYPFPYLIDSDQSVAKAYRAACTPDFYLFDPDHKLYYRGQFDSSSPGNTVKVTGQDLRAATKALLAGEKAPAYQKPSIGCSIKWKPGNEPAYITGH